MSYFEDTAPTIKATMSDDEFTSVSCVYSHTTLTGELMFIGSCKLAELFRAPDAHRNSEWIATFRTGSAPYTLQVLLISNDAVKCFNQAYAFVKQYRPHCNIKGARTLPGRVQCDQTGEIYPNAAAACRMLDIKPSAMSNHLNGNGYNKTVRGFTFKRI